MQILNDLFGPQAENYQRSLNRLSLRQSVLAGNLANINTPGYKRKEVDFAIELKQAESGLFNDASSDDAAAVTTDPGAIRLDGNGVDMEREVFLIGENEIRYQAATDMTRNYFSGLRRVIREGR